MQVLDVVLDTVRGKGTRCGTRCTSSPAGQKGRACSVDRVPARQCGCAWDVGTGRYHPIVGLQVAHALPPPLAEPSSRVEHVAKRKRKAEQGDKPVVFRQNELPEQFRTQVIHIWLTTIRDPQQRVMDFHQEARERAWSALHDIMCRELGVFCL